MIKVSLIFGTGNLNIGFNNIIARISHQNDSISQQYHSSLPACESIIELQKRWQFLYQALLGRFIRGKFEIDETEGFTPNISISNLEKTASEIAHQFNNWLASDSFREIDRPLLQLSKNEPIRLTIETEDSQLIRLPWHLWRFCQDNPLIGVGFSPLNRHGINISNSQSVKILGILGDSTGIDLEGDRDYLESVIREYKKGQLTFFKEPSRQELNEQLWNREWDILFFAGHSKSIGNSGTIAINPRENITIEQLKYALKRGIQQGLKLAVFNSCDGLGLAKALADLQLPQIIIMQEDVPNEVAQQFLKYFVESLTKGKTIEIAKREAQEKLQGLEGKYAGATWLPILFQHPDSNWHPFSIIKPESEAVNWLNICQEEISKQKNLTSNPLTLNEERFNLDDIFVPLGLLERKKKEKKDKNSGAIDEQKGSNLDKFGTSQPSDKQEETEEITREYSHDEFFAEVLAKRESPKSKGKRIAIIGEPGAGKTTQLQKIADWVLSQNQIPVWVSLADLQGKTIEEYLLQVWLKDVLKVARVTPEQENELVELFNQGQVWLLLDGVDEMGETNPLAEINHQLRGWLTSAKILLTCRVNVWDAGKNYLQEFDIYRNLDVSEDLREEFVNKWFSHQPDLAESLESALNQTGKERIKDLVRNPLRLTLLCSFWQRRQGDLPETKAGLYQQFVKVFYEWKEEYFPTTAKQRRELNQALGVLAREAIDKSNSRFRLTHSEVCQYLGDEDSESFKLAIDLGWLNQVGVAAENPDEVVYAFYHPTFQEYFTALTVDDWHFFLTHIPDNPSEGIYRIFEPQWKEVYLLWLGRNDINNEQKEELIESLYNFNDNCGDFYSFRAFLQAVIGIGEFKQSKLADKIIDKLIEISFGYFDEDKDNLQKYVSWQKDTAEFYLKQTDVRKLITKLCNLLKLYQEKNIQDDSFYRRRIIKIGDDTTYIQRIIESIQNISINNYSLTKQVIIFFAEKKDWNGIKLFFYPDFFSVIQKSSVTKILKNKMSSDLVECLNNLIKETNDNDKQDIISLLFDLGIYKQEYIDYLLNLVINESSSFALKTLNILPNNYEYLFYNLLNNLQFKQENKSSNYDLVLAIYKNKFKHNERNVLIYLNSIIEDNNNNDNLLIKACYDLLDIDKTNTKANDILVSIILENPNRIAINNSRKYGIIYESISEDAAKELVKMLKKAEGKEFDQSIEPDNAIVYREEITLIDLDKISILNNENLVKLENLFEEEFKKVNNKKNNYILFELANIIFRFDPNRKTIIDSLSSFMSGDNPELCLSAIHILNEHQILLKDQILLYNAFSLLNKINYLTKYDFEPDFDEEKSRELQKRIIINNIINNNHNIEEKEKKLILFLEKFCEDNSLFIRKTIDLFLQKNQLTFILLSWLKTKAEQCYLLKENATKYHLKSFYAQILVKYQNININEAITIFNEILSSKYYLFARIIIDFLLKNNFMIKECLITLENWIDLLQKGIQLKDDEFSISLSFINQIIELLYKNNYDHQLNKHKLINLLNEYPDSEDIEYEKLKLAQEIIKIEPHNTIVIEYLITILISSEKSHEEWVIIEVEPGIEHADSYIGYNAQTASSILIKANFKNLLSMIISNLKNCLFNELEKKKEKISYRIESVNQVLWHCATNYSYPEFYLAWHSQGNIHPEMREIMPIGENNLTQTLQQQISVNSLKQLQATDAVYPIIIDLFTLAGETEQKEIVLEISYQIYQQVFPNDADIPEINNAPQLKRIVPKIKQYLQKEKIILIFYNYDPYPELVNFCQKISDSFNLGWVTTKPVESFIRGFLPNQTNLLTVMQNWLNDL